MATTTAVNSAYLHLSQSLAFLKAAAVPIPLTTLSTTVVAYGPLLKYAAHVGHFWCSSRDLVFRSL